jgi:hypothetical protein
VSHHTVEWQDRGREPQCPPNPAYPNGKPLRLTDIVKARVKHCKVDVPYPAKRCGLYVIECQKCGLRVGVTTAGRPDDPTYIELACGQDTALQLTALGMEPYIQDGQVRLP